jgi:hypothetical protein
MTLSIYYRHFGKWHERSREPGLTALLIIEVSLIFFATPLTSMGALPPDGLTILFSLLVFATLAVTWHSKIAAIAVLISVVLSVVGSYLHAQHPSVLTDWLMAGGRLLAIAAMSIVIARAVFGPGRVSIHRIQGAVVLYLNFGLFFFTMFRLLDFLDSNSFHGLPQSGQEFGSGAALLYFSFSTLTTVGYGDIAPLHPIARNLANLESVIGQLYPATLLARLVSLEIEHRRQSRTS